LLIDSLDSLKDMRSIGFTWKTAVLLLEMPDTSEGEVELLGAAEESEIWGLEAAVLC